MMTRSVMTITQAAAERIHVLAEVNHAFGIRLSLRKGGCAGLEYAVDLVTEPDPGDEHIEYAGAHVYIARESLLFLFGTELDFEDAMFRSGFIFRNPNQKSSCGCGESVALEPVDPGSVDRISFRT